MIKIELKKATNPLCEYANARDFEPILLTSNGKPVAALIHVEAFSDREITSLGLNPKFMEIIEESRARAKKEGTRSLDDLKERFGIGRPRRMRK